MRILIVAPTHREFRNITAAVEKRTAPHHDYTIIESGIGKAGAAAAVGATLATAEQPFDRIVVIGFAAGSKGMHQGDIVVPNRAQYHDCDVPEGFIPELTDPLTLAGREEITVFTGDSFVNAKSVAEIKARFGVEMAIFDMEITAVAIAARLFNNVSVAAVKFISDVPEDGHNEMSYDEFADSHADFSPLLDRIEAM
jgi:nucleoside phosphorylase